MKQARQQAEGMFLRSAVEKILSDRDIKKKENLQLKKSCENVLEELKAESTDGHNSVILPDKERIIEADRYFLPFELACRSKSPKIVITALDCLQKLIAYGHLTGRGADSSNPDRKLIDRIVEAICSSFIGQGTDEAVLLQIIKAILAVVLTNNCEVHEGSLLLAVRTCFTIFLATKSPINQSTAKGTLTQSDDADVRNQLIGSSSTIWGELDGNQQDDHVSFPNVEHKDAFLIFRSLCVLAQKEEGDLNDPRQGFLPKRYNYMSFEVDHSSNTHLNSKMLALEMLLLILQNASTALQNAQPFILLIKRSLCVALSRNAVSSNVKVFFKEIIISMLESSSCSFEHKWIVLHTIGKILANPQSVVDLYVNYDCDLTAYNVFENLVDVVSKTARTSINETASTVQKERQVYLFFSLVSMFYSFAYSQSF
ncbi:hypothetical protein DICVIV_12443 [Dictyocaulus viviparus]|uniref:Mon2/Sec7/BIG1-like dimerisation and cyclophilin-binding domain-containing protein n=1 Tax=Dictyocaulus viviparus TaxID=29172 RepID=A0A0D8XD48_DICVI|nr:hypothetical protein DICVIV_12443 [Dictyocaulus viviparus]